MSKYIIDISHYHPVTNWTKAKEISYCLISKGTQGTGFVDSTLKSFINGCETNKIPYWLYCFPERNIEVESVKFFLKTVKPLIGKYFVGYALDVESYTKKVDGVKKTFYVTNEGATKAMKLLQAEGYKTMLYTGQNEYDRFKETINACIGGNTAWWESRYGKDDGNYPDLNKYPIHNCDLHQYTSQKVFSCFTDGVDVNKVLEKASGKKLEWYTTVGKVDSKKETIASTTVTTVTATEEKKVTNMAVRIGSARINENGGINGGSKGDQTGNEVGFQDWYLHSKGWVVIRPKNKTHAEKIAKNMENACNNNKIGYCQDHRYDLLSYSKQYGYDASKVTTKCEVDCSALVRVCCKYAGIDVGDFATSDEVGTLKATGKFDILYEDKYCKTSNYLQRGDILVTKTKGHTVVVLSNGKYAVNNGKTYEEANPKCYLPKTLPSRGWWRNGDNHTDCLRIKKFLNWAVNANLSKTSGKFGDKTEEYLKKFQKLVGITADGEWGKDTQREAQQYRL